MKLTVFLLHCGRPISCLAHACAFLRLGCPTLLLAQLLPVTEISACEIDPDAAHALLANSQGNHPKKFHVDIHEQVAGRSFDYIAGRVTVTGSDGGAHADCYLCGYPCNSNSLLNAERFQCDATTTSHASVLESSVAMIAQTLPSSFVLENVAGVLLKRGGNGPDKDKTVLDWVNKTLQDKLGEKYTWFSIKLRSNPLPFRSIWLDCMDIQN